MCQQATVHRDVDGDRCWKQGRAGLSWVLDAKKGWLDEMDHSHHLLRPSFIGGLALLALKGVTTPHKDAVPTSLSRGVDSHSSAPCTTELNSPGGPLFLPSIRKTKCELTTQ